MTERNLRRYPRKTTRIEARVVLDRVELDGRIENIGEGGVFFVTDTLEGVVTEGDRAEIRFTPEGSDRETRVRGEVLRVERDFHEGEILRTLAIRFERPLS